MEHLSLVRKPGKWQVTLMTLGTLTVFLIVDYFFALHSVFERDTAGSVVQNSKGVVWAEVSLRFGSQLGLSVDEMPTVAGLRPSKIHEVSTFQEKYELESAGVGNVIEPRVHYQFDIEEPVANVNLLEVVELFQRYGIGLRKLLLGGYGHYHFNLAFEPLCKQSSGSGECATLDVWMERKTLSRVRQLQNTGHLGWIDSFLFDSKNGTVQVYARYNAMSDVLELIQLLQLSGVHPRRIGIVVSDFAED